MVTGERVSQFFCNVPPLFRNALARPLDVLGAPNPDVIAADNLLDLAGRAGAVIDKHGLAFAQLSHGWFFF